MNLIKYQPQIKHIYIKLIFFSQNQKLLCFSHDIFSFKINKIALIITIFFDRESSNYNNLPNI